MPSCHTVTTSTSTGSTGAGPDRSRTRRTLSGVVASVVAAVALAGCGGNARTAASHHGSVAAPATAPGGPRAAGPHNPADVTFLTDMLPHHAQAVEMASMALSRDTAPQLAVLAQQIKQAQAPEIDAMTGWLVGWGAPVPVAGDMGHDMGHEPAGGMMSTTDMAALDTAAGNEFARRWLTAMTGHHTGAVAMARTEIAQGHNADAQQLARSIIASQSAEISLMKTMLAALPA